MHPILAVKFDPRAASVAVSDETLTITLVDGRTISQPLAWTPGLVTATAKQRADYKLLGGGVAVAWDKVGEDVYVALMLSPCIPAPARDEMNAEARRLVIENAEILRRLAESKKNTCF